MSSVGTGQGNGRRALLVLPAASRVCTQASEVAFVNATLLPRTPSAWRGTRTWRPGETLTGALPDTGLEVADAGPYRGFGHRVDQAIVRDIVIARRP